MSTIKANTIDSLNGADEVSIPTLDGRMATAWVNFNGTGVISIRDSYNVESITDNGIGEYIINFSTPMDHANYMAMATSQDTTSNLNVGGVADNFTTTGFSIRTGSKSNNNGIDLPLVVACVFGGKINE